MPAYVCSYNTYAWTCSAALICLHSVQCICLAYVFKYVHISACTVHMTAYPCVCNAYALHKPCMCLLIALYHAYQNV